jgi:hypothetical protein
MDDRRTIADFIDHVYANSPIIDIAPLRNRHLSFYRYNGRHVEYMSDEEAPNIVMTRLTYAA